TDLYVVDESEAVINLRLHRVEEGLDKGVVGHLSRPVHALPEAQLGKPIFERASRVLAASVGVEHEAALGASARHGTVERAQRQRYVLPRSIAPANDATTVLVHDHGQIAVDAADLEICDVANPNLVRAGELEVELLIEHRIEVALDGRIGIADRRDARLDTVPAHEPRHPILADSVAAPAQRLVHPWAAIGATALLVHHADLARQGFIVALTLATLARAPSIEPGSR